MNEFRAMAGAFVRDCDVGGVGLVMHFESIDWFPVDHKATATGWEAGLALYKESHRLQQTQASTSVVAAKRCMHGSRHRYSPASYIHICRMPMRGVNLCPSLCRLMWHAPVQQRACLRHQHRGSSLLMKLRAAVQMRCCSSRWRTCLLSHLARLQLQARRCAV